MCSVGFLKKHACDPTEEGSQHLIRMAIEFEQIVYDTAKTEVILTQVLVFPSFLFCWGLLEK